MKFKNKINWLITWLAISMLKGSLRYRLTGDNITWLQSVAPNGVLIFNRVDFIIDQCLHKTVLHVGFSDYPYTVAKIADESLLHLQLKKMASSILGLDNDEHAIQQYKELTKDGQVVWGDITDCYPAEATSFNPDIILLSEVLEHLADPYQAVDLLFNSFAHGTKILVTVPNYAALDCIAASIHNTETIHPHHCWYFSPFTLNKLFDSNRFHLEQLHFGMYYQPKKNINMVMRKFPFNGDCIMAVFLINKS